MCRFPTLRTGLWAAGALLCALFMTPAPAGAQFTNAPLRGLSGAPGASAVSGTDTLWLCQLASGCGVVDPMMSASIEQINTYLSASEAALTNHTIDCSLNTCLNFPGGATLPTIARGHVIGNGTGGTTTAADTVLGTLFDAAFGSTVGGVICRQSGGWTYLTPGSSGQFLETFGPGSNCAWGTASGGGGLNQITGDVTAGPGTGSQAATVVALQGRGVSSAAPVSTNVMAWNGTQWAPAAATGGSGVVGTGTTGQVAGYPSGGTAVAGVTVSGDFTLSGSTGVGAIGNNVVTNAKAAQGAADTLKGNNTGSAANEADLTVSQVKTLLAYTFTDILAGSIANGTTATTQAPLSSDAKVATDHYVDLAVAAGGGGNMTGSGAATAGDVLCVTTTATPLNTAVDCGFAPLTVDDPAPGSPTIAQWANGDYQVANGTAITLPGSSTVARNGSLTYIVISNTVLNAAGSDVITTSAGTTGGGGNITLLAGNTVTVTSKTSGTFKASGNNAASSATTSTTPHGSANVTLAATDQYVVTCNKSDSGCTTGTWSAAATWQFLASSNYATGYVMIFADDAAVITNTNTLTITPGAGDTINNTTGISMNFSGGRISCKLDLTSKNWGCFGSLPNGAAAQLLVGQGATTPGNWVTPTGDWGINALGVTVNNKVNGVAYPATPSANQVCVTSSGTACAYGSADAALSSNVPLKNGANTWAGLNNFSGLAAPQRVVAHGSSVTVNTATDGTIVVSGGSGSTSVTYTCPATPFVFEITDGDGSDVTNTITITPGVGQLNLTSGITLHTSGAAVPAFDRAVIHCDGTATDNNSWVN